MQKHFWIFGTFQDTLSYTCTFEGIEICHITLPKLCGPLPASPFCPSHWPTAGNFTGGHHFHKSERREILKRPQSIVVLQIRLEGHKKKAKPLNLLPTTPGTKSAPYFFCKTKNKKTFPSKPLPTKIQKSLAAIQRAPPSCPNHDQLYFCYTRP